MQEIELKLILDARQEQALRRSPTVRALSISRARTQTLHNVYYDSADAALRREGIALRLRKIGRQWVQTVKQATGSMMHGLSTPLEHEIPLRGPELHLELIEDDDLRELILGFARTGLRPVVETNFRRTSRMLRSEGGSEIELAIDVGELSAGHHTASFSEAELELKSGVATDLYAVGAEIFDQPPIRFATLSKSARAAALLDRRHDKPFIRKARRLSLSRRMTVEDAATVILREGLAHYLPNIADAIASDALHGPHQARVALRRMRSAISTFRKVLGQETLQPWADTMQEIASELGAIRDLDVLLADLLVPLKQTDPEAYAALSRHVETRRRTTRKRVNTSLKTPEVTKFGFRMAGFLEARGWQDPMDKIQSRRLSQPLGPLAKKSLRKRWEKVAAYGLRMDLLTIDERHEMRKALKKLRYMLEAFRDLFSDDAVSANMRAIKGLQDAFGALNDQAMAETLLLGGSAPGARDPVAQRGVGRLLGYIDVEADRLWPQAQRSYAMLAALPKPWD